VSGHALASARIDAERRNEFIRGPKWRTRTSPARRHRAALITFAVVVVTGGVILGAILWLLAWLGAPTWLAIAPWLVPTAATVVWALARPAPAVVSDDDDDAWTTYSIQYVLVGEHTPRPRPARLVAATLFGAPVIWSLLVFGLSTLIGLY
jgi:hypothetical protein